MKNLKIIMFGIVSSTIFTIIFLLSFSIFLVKNNLNEKYIPIMVFVFFCLAIFLGTILSTRKIKKNGAIYGIIISTVYVSFMYIISSTFIGNFILTKQSLYMIGCTLLLGTIGGIMGVNIK